MNDLAVMEQPKPMFPSINLEDPEMTARAVEWIANAFVRASDLAQEVKRMREEMIELRAAVTDAKHHKEIADAAYNQVNAARIEAENHVVSLRTERNALEHANHTITLELGDIKAKVVALEAEITKLTADHERLMEIAINEKIAALNKARDMEDLYNLAEEDKKQQAITIKGLEEDLARERGAAAALREANDKLQRVIGDINKVLQPPHTTETAAETAPEKPGNSHWLNQPRDDAGKWTMGEDGIRRYNA